MRDIVFLIAFCVLLFLAFRKPFIALSLWLWSGLFVPKHWLYGMAESISYNSVFAAVTLIGFLIHREKPKFNPDILFFLVFLFFMHTTLTSLFTLNIQAITWLSWGNFAKGILLFVMTCLVIRKKHHFDFLVWAIVLSIGFFGFVEGVKFLASGGGHSIRGPSNHILRDNNHFAAALCMVLPLIVYLFLHTPEKYIKIGLLGMLFICTLAVLGTYSRGGLIGLTAIGGHFWFKSRHKFKSILGILLVAVIAGVYLPDNWFKRMDTVESVTEDSSFMTRVNSWKMHTLMAIDRPLLGGGFKALEDSYIWNELAADIDMLDFIDTPPLSERGWAAHSIYFQVLGDHGFVGLFLFLMIIWSAFLKLSSIEKYYMQQNDKSHWQYNLAKMIKVSLVAYCVAGAALSLAYVELLYALISIIVCLTMVMKNDVIKEKSSKTENAEMSTAEMLNAKHRMSHF